MLCPCGVPKTPIILPHKALPCSETPEEQTSSHSGYCYSNVFSSAANKGQFACHLKKYPALNRCLPLTENHSKGKRSHVSLLGIIYVINIVLFITVIESPFFFWISREHEKGALPEDMKQFFNRTDNEYNSDIYRLSGSNTATAHWSQINKTIILSIYTALKWASRAVEMIKKRKTSS